MNLKLFYIEFTSQIIKANDPFASFKEIFKFDIFGKHTTEPPSNESDATAKSDGVTTSSNDLLTSSTSRNDINTTGSTSSK